ncbi:MAG TPA: hypothetical protein VFF67_07835 [Thermoplasmata archaeon]|nr:hypothetical protein [Thermoplasmata archaeon]
MGDELHRRQPIGPLRWLYGPPPDPPGPTPDEVRRHWVAYLRDRVENHWDNMVLLDGMRGSGKSTLAYQLATAVDRTFRPGDMEWRICGSPETLSAAVERATVGQVVVFDEAMMGFRGVDFMKRPFQELVSIFTVNRFRGGTFLVLSPSIHRLGAFFRDDIADVWIAIPVRSRGRAFVHLRTPGIRYEYGEKKPIWTKESLFNPLEWGESRGPGWEEFDRISRGRKLEVIRESSERLRRTRSPRTSRVPVVCPHCGHSWRALPARLSRQCPSCLRRFRIRNGGPD